MPKDDGFADDPGVIDLFGDDPAEPVPVPDPTTTPLIFITLDDAVAFVQAHLDDGVECPCCKQLVKLYKRPFNHNMAAFLCRLVVLSGPERNWVDIKEMPLRGGDYAKVRYWGFVELAPKDPNDTAKRTSGLWRPTYKGVKFAENKLRVPKRVHLYNKEVRGWDTQDISITEALGKKFDYTELMSA